MDLYSTEFCVFLVICTCYSGCKRRSSGHPQRLGDLPSQGVRCSAESRRRRRKQNSDVRRDDPRRPAVRRVRRISTTRRPDLPRRTRRQRPFRRDARGEVTRHSRPACDASRRRALDSSLHGRRWRRRQPRVLSRVCHWTCAHRPLSSSHRLPWVSPACRWPNII